MKKTTIKSSLISSLICSIFGHNFEISKKVTNHVSEYQCSHCKTELTTNSNGKLTILTEKHKEINSLLAQMHKNKMMRQEQRQLIS